MLKKIRAAAALFTFCLLTFYFLDFTGLLPADVRLQRVQFVPAFLSLNAAAMVFLLACAMLFGRVYCSVICPMGVLQDIAWRCSRGRRRTSGKNHVVLRLSVLAACLIPFLFGFTLILGILDPYSAYGRVAVHLFKPVYMLFNNALAHLFNHFGNYAFYRVEVTTLGVFSFAAAGATIAVIAVSAYAKGRLYCNTVCPAGTVLGYLNKYSLFKIRIDKDKCASCGVCEKMCKASCINAEAKTIDYSRCVNCFNCINNCARKAVSFSVGRNICSTINSCTLWLSGLLRFARNDGHCEERSTEAIRQINDGHCEERSDEAIRQINDGHCDERSDEAIRQINDGHCEERSDESIRQINDGHCDERSDESIRQINDGHCEERSDEAIQRVCATFNRCFNKSAAVPQENADTVDSGKREFMLAGLTAALAAPAIFSAAKAEAVLNGEKERRTAISPPGAVSAERLLKHCTSCHLCVSKCPARVLKPAFMEYGVGGVMIPVMYFEKGFCNFDCTICADVCPARALLPLTKEQKHRLQVGRVVFIKDRCVVAAKGTSCGACSEHCPTQAVKMIAYKNGLTIPSVDADICVGCGGCEFICPVRPYRAIYVEGNGVHRQARAFEVEKNAENEITDFGF